MIVNGQREMWWSFGWWNGVGTELYLVVRCLPPAVLCSNRINTKAVLVAMPKHVRANHHKQGRVPDSRGEG